MAIKKENQTNGEKMEFQKLSEETAGRLKGKRIYLYGQNTDSRNAWHRISAALRSINSQNGLEMVICMEEFGELSQEQNIPGKDDLAVIVGEMYGTGSDCLKQLDQCMKKLEIIGKTEPAAAVYISDSRVYGKKFGPQNSFRENELGYVCHTAMTETDRQCMRMAEHLVCRMAKEQNMPVKVVRMEQAPDAETVYRMMPYVLEILIKGLPGDIYNVAETEGLQKQDGGKNTETELLAWQESRSPLTAMEIRMNTEKVRNYVASELFE